MDLVAVEADTLGVSPHIDRLAPGGLTHGLQVIEGLHRGLRMPSSGNPCSEDFDTAFFCRSGKLSSLRRWSTFGILDCFE